VDKGKVKGQAEDEVLPFSTTVSGDVAGYTKMKLRITGFEDHSRLPDPS
jgi:hypothetical protein